MIIQFLSMGETGACLLQGLVFIVPTQVWRVLAGFSLEKIIGGYYEGRPVFFFLTSVA